MLTTKITWNLDGLEKEVVATALKEAKDKLFKAGMFNITVTLGRDAQGQLNLVLDCPNPARLVDAKKLLEGGC
jgi:hypothetical protein